jgi:O-acetyl-ADP-ribose deacetylase (regulator of RNase III)
VMEYRSGDILAADVEALVNTVNCVGVMGRGIALQFKNVFPANFRAYEAACRLGEVQPGRMFVYDTQGLTYPRYIVNFPTKRHWRGKSRMEDIESGLVALAEEIRARGIRSIAIPPLGSGLGGLSWSDVRPRIAQALEELRDLRVVVFEPNGAPAGNTMSTSREVPNMTPGRAALVVLVDRYLQGLLDPFVTLLELQKLMYFMQAAGQPLKLNYVQHHYGPYAENLRHVLRTIEGHLISGYGDGGDAPTKQLELVPGAVEDAVGYLKDDTATQQRFERVADLVDGFESPFGLELLSTVHWVASQHPEMDEQDIAAQVHMWSERKRHISPGQIGLALRVLLDKGWLTHRKHAEVAA